MMTWFGLGVQVQTVADGAASCKIAAVQPQQAPISTISAPGWSRQHVEQRRLVIAHLALGVVLPQRRVHALDLRADAGQFLI